MFFPDAVGSGQFPCRVLPGTVCGNCLSYFPSDSDSVSLIHLVFSWSYFISFWERKKNKLFYLVSRNTTCYSFFSKYLKLSRKQTNTHPHVTHSGQPGVSPPGSETAPSSSPAICALLLTIWSGCGKVGRAWLLWSMQDLVKSLAFVSCSPSGSCPSEMSGALQASPYCPCFFSGFAVLIYQLGIYLIPWHSAITKD